MVSNPCFRARLGKRLCFSNGLPSRDRKGAFDASAEIEVDSRVFEVCLQAAQSIVPAAPDHLQTAPRFCETDRVERPDMLPARTLSVDNAGSRQELKMLRDCLARDPEVIGQCGNGSRPRFG